MKHSNRALRGSLHTNKWRKNKRISFYFFQNRCKAFHNLKKWWISYKQKVHVEKYVNINNK